MVENKVGFTAINVTGPGVIKASLDPGETIKWLVYGGNPCVTISVLLTEDIGNILELAITMITESVIVRFLKSSPFVY